MPRSNAVQPASQTNDPLHEEDGLEVEQESNEEITQPFNPEDIKIRTVNVVVNQIVSRIDHKEIDLAPDFQRRSGIWDNKRKSRLIESLLLRIPIPAFYVAADEDENWSVVDGLQRLTTINEYVKGGFTLRNLEYLNALHRRRHDELSRPMQRRISETQLVVNVIEFGTPDEVMFNVFSRINTLGMRLNEQEIRNALNPGYVRNYLKRLGASKEFKKATNDSISSTRMGDRECVLRFLAFHMEPWEGYSANSLDGYLAQAMRRINKMRRRETTALSNDFKRAMLAAADIFGEEAFRKPPGDNGRRRPVNKALFDAWSVQLARCSIEQIDTLIEKRSEVRKRFRTLAQDPEFNNVISSATGTPTRIRRRFHAIEELVEEILDA